MWRSTSAAVGIMLLLVCEGAVADLASWVTDPDNGYNELEIRAGLANQAVFDDLERFCGESPSSFCDVDTFLSNGGNLEEFSVYSNTRELVQTANDLEGTGPTDFSLGLDTQNLGFALRWTAGEEFAAQGSSATEFTNGQLANVNSRLTALRFGASGFRIAAIPGAPADAFASIADVYSGDELQGAAGEAELSRWGLFGNFTYGWGDKGPTDREAAFDFDNLEGTLGVDYRFDNGFVVGGALGYTDNEVDFDSSQSIVDGGVESDGYSLTAFSLFSRDRFYLSGLVSYQGMDFEVDRFIRYPSLNPNVDGANARSNGDTESDAWSFAVSSGYPFQFGNYSVEPYVRAEYLDIEIDSFNETNVRNLAACEAEEINCVGFVLKVDDQSFESFDVGGGLRLAAAMSTRYGVYIPYVRGEWHFELEDDARTISSTYTPVGTADPDVNFALATDKPDDQYGIATIGLAGYVRGARQSELGGRYFGGLSFFIEYRTAFELRNIDNEVVTGGFRYEF